MALSDMNKAPTVLTLLLLSMATVGVGLFSLAELVGNWMEPDCDVPAPRDVDYCSITAEDYSRAAPAAAVSLLLLLFTAWMYRRALPPRSVGTGNSRAARNQARIVIALGIVAALGSIAMAVLVNLT